MSESEFDEVLTELCIHWPSISDWFKQIASPKLTLATWRSTLSQVSIEEAFSVIDRWSRCVLPNPPVGYRREIAHLEILNIVLEDRRRQNQDALKDDSRESLAAKIGRERRYNPAFAIAYSRMLDLGRKVRDGYLVADSIEYQREHQTIMQEFDRDSLQRATRVQADLEITEFEQVGAVEGQK